MSNSRLHTWQDIQAKIKQNIVDRTWSPGELIPGEVKLAEEFGCSRTTVNRALRELASTGVIDRKRKAGTRVAMQTARRVTAEIPVIRAQVEELGDAYSFKLHDARLSSPTPQVKTLMKLRTNCKVWHIRSTHYAGDRPFIYEDRWINAQTIPAIADLDLRNISVNEWLVENVPFTNGEFSVEAKACPSRIAKHLEVAGNEAVLTSQRMTWLDDQSVTLVGLYYAPGYKMQFLI